MHDVGKPPRHLTLVTSDAPDAAPDAKPTATPKQHPQGVWDVPAAAGYRRIVAVDADGNLAIELNMTERIPLPVRVQLVSYVERAVEKALQALKV